MLLCGGRTCAGPVQTEACRMLLKILLGFLCGLSSLAAARDTSQRPPPLLLVSFDGFRADYLQTFPMPNLTLLYSQGVLVEQLNNVFITKTFPNHYSLVTGLYAESHGILSSSMYDPATQKHFKPGDDTDPIWWNQAEPLWTTALDSGYKTAAMMWPGSDVAIRNRTATHFFRYNASMTFRERLGHVVKWMLGNETDEAVMFAALYWEEPDRSGHIFGPDNKTVMSMVLKEVDDDIGLLISELKRNGLWGHVNVIVTSDHGMVQCSAERLIRLENCLDPKMYMVVDMTPVAAIIPKKDPEAVFAMLDNCHPHMTAYLKKAIPDRLHYRNNRLIQPIILVADEGWTIVQSGDKPPRLGDHGYDNSLPSMHPFLAATGPSFRQGYRTRELQSVDIYPMMCHLLSVPPRPNNGSLAHSRCLLAGESCMDSPLVVGLVVVVMVVLTIITVLFRLLKSRRPAGPRPFRRLQLDDDDDDDEALLD